MLRIFHLLLFLLSYIWTVSDARIYTRYVCSVRQDDTAKPLGACETFPVLCPYTSLEMIASRSPGSISTTGISIIV